MEREPVVLMGAFSLQRKLADAVRTANENHSVLASHELRDSDSRLRQPADSSGMKSPRAQNFRSLGTPIRYRSPTGIIGHPKKMRGK